MVSEVASYVGPALAISLPLSLGVAAAGAAAGLGTVFAAAVEGMARQPEASGKIMVNTMIGGALIEAMAIYVLIMIFLLMGKMG
jgi:F-type H+-transporting ATPase subunit c